MTIQMNIPKIAYILPFILKDDGSRQPVTKIDVKKGGAATMTLSVFLLDIGADRCDITTRIAKLDDDDVAGPDFVQMLREIRLSPTSGGDAVIDFPVTFAPDSTGFYQIDAEVFSKDNPYVQRKHTAKAIIEVTVGE